MNNLSIWLVVVIVSIVFGVLDQISATNEKSRTRRVLDIWRHTVNYFFTAVLIYFFLVVRWPIISQNAELTVSDFVVGLAIIIGVFGWWPYVIKNFTEGINAIISRALDKR